jgi:hypothetical protein
LEAVPDAAALPFKALAQRENAKLPGPLTQRKCEYRADG